MATSAKKPQHDSILCSYFSEHFGNDGINNYYETWAQFDPKGSGFIGFQQLPEFIEALELPLQIKQPNKFKIYFMDIPIYEGDLVKCEEVLKQLILDCFARDGNAIDDKLEEEGTTSQNEVVSSSMWRQREEACARIIQNAWNKHKSS